MEGGGETIPSTVLRAVLPIGEKEGNLWSSELFQQAPGEACWLIPLYVRGSNFPAHVGLQQIVANFDGFGWDSTEIE